MGGMVLLLLGQSIGKIILKPLKFLKRSNLPQDHQTDTNLIAELKKWAAVEKVNENMYHISSIKSENQEVFWTFHVSVMQINGKEMYKNGVLQLDLLLFFTVLVKGIQRLIFHISLTGLGYFS